ncbi:hypothetical protein I204_07821 [Kwoniella mangroviensis CBS 8886]|uniref:hypothetical protein n=1 Tax=Kwoniella mangroviensis CBS 8507 TaxID=1296122 RepID=UPI00080CCB5E|nr:uncharacterized protein I203_05192 [Kwoniella mangroviensis CBS 8507]OCF65517.1 hypothetical protein I203_05192 [Kwoniella mangroviensis CBS 8507]OCF71758.1 hypothetical protein I204_07821 [Kwoniella mangroviensis CBS 8886]
MHNNQYPSDKSLSSLFALPTPSPPSSSAVPRPPYSSSATNPNMNVRSPTIPNSPAPAYTALPHRDVDFHFTPILEGKIGDVELETVDGKRFLVHKKVLEQETVFFHIYYGFVPVWRLNSATSSSSSSSSGTGATLPHDITVPIHQSSNSNTTSTTSSQTSTHHSQHRISTSLNGFSNIRSLPKIIANTLTRNSISLPPTTIPVSVPMTEEVPPPLPPKDVITAPTPTSSPYTWVVPETSTVLLAFLSLIYPRGVISSGNGSLLDSLELTGRVVRASLGYQSSKALSKARDRLGHWIEDLPIETYSMACFFKFNDLIKLSSQYALKVPYNAWPEDAKLLMGRGSINRLVELQQVRLLGLNNILSKPLLLDNNREHTTQQHTIDCRGLEYLEELWNEITTSIKMDLKPSMDLYELLQLDLTNCGITNCASCLGILGKNVQTCLLEARDLPRSL